MMWPHVRYIAMMRQQLARYGHNARARLDEDAVIDVIPHYWREEAPSIPEWFERTCRGLGLNCNYDLIKREFTLSLQ